MSPDDPSAHFLMADTVVAFANSASTLERWIIYEAESKITKAGFRVSVQNEARNGRMEWRRESVEVELTGRTLGCLLEFRIPSDANGVHRLRYAFAERFEVRRI